jgi:outer membrane protein OmpA-like peptidoglycan-associated protein
MLLKYSITLLLAGLIGLYLPAQVIPYSSKAKKVENEVNRYKKKDKDNKQKEEQPQEDATVDQTYAANGQAAGDDQQPQLVWSAYDFIPGDRVIFEDDLTDEENGEFPSRWDLKAGNVEVAKFGGENVIMFRDGHPTIIPYLKDAQEDYLPEVFTIEFDLYCGTDNFVTYLFDRKNQKSGSPTGYTYLNTNYYRMEFGTSSSRHPEEKTLEKRRWIHVAIAYNKGKLKAYMDEVRLINIPRIDFDPKGLTLHSYHCRNDNLYYVKNIRIAAGGIKYYDRIMEEGRVVANGIRFDSGKATLKPESMGIINEMVEVMNEHPDLNIIIEGHTDSDGDENDNLNLSEARANTVLHTMTKMGIPADRMKAAGYGESRPIDTNDTPEGKANNRRVEFVKTEVLAQ